MSPRRILLLLIVALLPACSQLEYYAQAAKGQWQIISERQKINQLLDNASIPSDLKQKLELVSQIRAFASDSLDLPDNNTFRYYTDLKRSHVVWNVIATPPFDINPKTWCFPIAGCVFYKGFFSEEDANQLTAQLQEQGFDTYQYGVTAYSTLGWFSDPILNTFISYNESSLAGLIFHELAHQVIYVKDDSGFNEAFATAVEIAGVKRWIDQHTSSDASRQYLKNRANNDAISEMVLEFRDRLAEMYSNDAESNLTQLKSNMFKSIKQRYEELQHFGKGTPFYDWWFGLELNNAHLSSIATYHRLVPKFSKILSESNSFSEFYETVGKLTALPLEERNKQLNEALSEITN